MSNKFTVILVFMSLLSVHGIGQNKRPSSNSGTPTSVSRITSSDYLEQLIQKKSTSEYVITSEHVSSTSGIKHTYVRQAINGLEVFGTESSFHTDADGKTVLAHVNFVKEIESSVKNASASITAEQAIARVAQQMNYHLSNLDQLESPSGINQKGLYNGAGISGTDIPVKLMYYYQEGIGTHLVWELSVQELTSEDWWNFRVDAGTGAIIDKDNFTVYCDIMGDHSEHGSEASTSEKLKVGDNRDRKTKPVYNVADENNVLTGSYRVFAFPLESPYYGARTLEVNPADATASPFGWHDTDGASGAEYTYTKGNNADAYDDDNNSNSGTVAKHADGGAGFIFDYAFDATTGGFPVYNATNQSEKAAIVNLFYWNNIIHDAMYHYGFDETAGNFQENNYGNGGAGGDSVNAEAQDGGGTCNANFATPSDGSKPRMQMYVCNNAGDSDSNDGDYDNLVIIHEYAHGISNRLTGGPGVANGLQNAEQMGEGWSDYYGYMLTMTPSNYNSDRTTGTFLFEQGIAGQGIRPAPYSTSLVTNPWTYAGVANTGSISQPHGIGFIWASMLFEMTQALIVEHGFDPNIYTGDGGNNISLKLVTEGLKLQPTSPGFVDGRDAILAADVALYGGANTCTIWEAFAKRGLGYSASQGSSGSRTDGLEAFDLPPSLGSFNALDTICETQGTQTGLGGGTPAGGTYSGTGVTDNGNGTFDFDPTIGGPGDAIVTYSVVNPCNGLIENIDDTILVTSGIPDLVCQDATVTLDVNGNATITKLDVLADLQPTSLTTSLASNNGQAGNMFDLMAVNDITINSFDINMDDGTTADVQVYFKTGTWVGSQTTPSDWTLMATVPGVTSAGTDQPTALNLSMGIDVIAGNRVAFYVTLVNSTAINYINGTTVGSEWASDANLIVYEGAGKAYPFNNTFQPRNFSGNIMYRPLELPDNCGNPVSINLSQSSFSCSDIGDVTVTVTIDDGAGGTNTCDAIVTVVGPTIINGDNPCEDLFFITKWVVSASETITIPTTGSGYDYNVDWSYNAADGFNAESMNVTGDVTSPVLSAGEHIIAISGDFPRIYFNNNGDKDKIIEIVQWGPNPWSSMLKAFQGCSNLNITSPTAGAPNLSSVTNMSQMFNKAASFNGDIGDWDVSNVTNMAAIFADCHSFNQNLNNWNVSAVTNMDRMFLRNYVFDQNLNNWITTNVTNMKGMFQQASSFDGAIGNWDVSNVENAEAMFFYASAFNQNISNWNTSSVTNMFRMFRAAPLFDQNLGAWDITNVTNMNEMFLYSELSIPNYDDTLIGWATDSSGNPSDGIDDIPTSITFDGGSSVYCIGETSKALLMNSLPAPSGYGWIITDGGLSCGDSESLFITKWVVLAGETITIPTTGSDYDYNVDWSYNAADGFNAESTNVTGDVTSPVLTAGEHIIAISGNFPRIYFNNNGDKDKIIEIVQWGTNPWTSMVKAFAGCSNLNILNPNVGVPNLSFVTNMSQMFERATSFNGAIGDWDVSNVTNMAAIFADCHSFNQNLNNWNVSAVTNMDRMFLRNYVFDQNLNNWITTNVTNMKGMFQQASSFDGAIGNWDVSNVENAEAMFFYATVFNQNISSWNTYSVTNMFRMFRSATSFDQDLGAWDLGNVMNMEQMFFRAELSTNNYDTTLIGWAADSSGTPGDGIDDIPTSITFDGGSSTYCAGEAARTSLESTFNWNITDSGLGCVTPLLGSNSSTQLNVDSISLYPNPTESLVTIVSLQTIVSSATVFDIRGRKVFEVDFRNKTSYQIDLSDMEAAVYFIEIATENGTVMKRVMKK